MHQADQNMALVRNQSRPASKVTLPLVAPWLSYSRPASIVEEVIQAGSCDMQNPLARLQA